MQGDEIVVLYDPRFAKVIKLNDEYERFVEACLIIIFGVILVIILKASDNRRRQHS